MICIFPVIWTIALRCLGKFVIKVGSTLKWKKNVYNKYTSQPIGKGIACNSNRLELVHFQKYWLLRFSLFKNVIKIQSYPCQALLPCCTRIQKTHKILNFPLVRVAFAFQDLDIPDPLKNSFQNRVLCQLWIRSKSCNISPIHLKFKKYICTCPFVNFCQFVKRLI